MPSPCSDCRDHPGGGFRSSPPPHHRGRGGGVRVGTAGLQRTPNLPTSGPVVPVIRGGLAPWALALSNLSGSNGCTGYTASRSFFGLSDLTDCAGRGTYRGDALSQRIDVTCYYVRVYSTRPTGYIGIKPPNGGGPVRAHPPPMGRSVSFIVSAIVTLQRRSRRGCDDHGA